MPKVSIIWLNYNSSKFIDIALKSLSAIMELDFPSDMYKLIVVDNCSIDGSFGRIRDILEEERNLKKTIIRLRRNLGYTGGNNIGYKYSHPASKYIVLINNDLIPYEESLKELIKFMEANNNVGAVQGIIHNYGAKTIDNAGFICSETLVNYAVKRPFESPYPVTYASGAYMVLRKEAIERIGKLFDWEGFLYFDDWPLGYRLWMHGYKVMALPISVGEHYGGASGGLRSPRTLFFLYRGLAMLIEMSNSRFKSHIKATLVKYLPVRHSSLQENLGLIKYAIKGLHTGLELGKYKRNHGDVLDIYSAPIINSSFIRKIAEILLP